MRHLRSGTSVTTPSTELGSVLLAALLLLLLGIGGPFGFAGSGVAAAAPDPFTVNIVAVDAETGDPIPSFKWLINIDNSHSNPSVTPPASYSPVVASGDETTATGITVDGATPDDRGYLVSVVANDGGGGVNDPDYKIGGQHFSSAGTLVVELVPNPLPLAAVRVQVFHDNQLVNAEHDIVFEEGLAGFHVTLNERIGEVTTDWFGNPLCTEYEDINPPTGFGPEDVGPDGPTPIPGTGGFCATDADGLRDDPEPRSEQVRGPGHPARRLELDPDDDDRGQARERRLGRGRALRVLDRGRHQHPGGRLRSATSRPCSFGNASDDCPTNNSAGTATINGKVRSIALDDESGVLLLGNAVRRPYVALNNIGGNDEQVYTARGNVDGTFSIPNVPVGLYQLVMWDGPLDHIISFLTVRVSDAGRGRQPRRHRHPALVRDDQGQGLHRRERERYPRPRRALRLRIRTSTPASRTGRSSTRRSRTRAATTSSRRCSSSSTSRSPRSATGT